MKPPSVAKLLLSASGPSTTILPFGTCESGEKSPERGSWSLTKGTVWMPMDTAPALGPLPAGWMLASVHNSKKRADLGYYPVSSASIAHKLLSKGREHVHGTCMREEGARGPWPSDQILIKWGALKMGFF